MRLVKLHPDSAAWIVICDCGGGDVRPQYGFPGLSGKTAGARQEFEAWFDVELASVQQRTAQLLNVFAIVSNPFQPHLSYWISSTSQKWFDGGTASCGKNRCAVTYFNESLFKVMVVYEANVTI